MIDANFILSKLPPFSGHSKIIEQNQTVKDIKKAILQSFEADKKQYASIAPFFVGKDVVETCKNVWYFLRANVKNVTEGVELQTVKTPAAIIATGKTTGSDCKNYSLFVAGVLDAINRNGLQKIPIAFRFCKYRQYDGSYLDHVFIVVNAGKKNEIWIDCIADVPYFNYRRLPDYYTDKKINSMALVRMSGTQINNREFAAKLIAERNKRIAKGTLKPNSLQDMRYVKALRSMGAIKTDFDFTNVTAQVSPQMVHAVQQGKGSSAGSFLDAFAAGAGGGGINVANILSGNIDVASMIKGGAVQAANMLLPGSGPAIDAAIKMLESIIPGKGGLYKDWSKDADGGLAEVVRWTLNDGDSPKQEAADVMRLIEERGWSTYLNKPTKYGDRALTVQDVINKLNRVGLTDVAAKVTQSLQQALQQGTQSMQPHTTVVNGEVIATPQKKDNTLMLVGLAAAALLILKK